MKLGNISKKNIVFIIFLIGLDVYLLSERVYLKRDLENVNTELLEYNGFKNEINYMNFGEFVDFQKISRDIIQYKKTEFGFIILLKGKDCSTCISQEVIKLNQLNISFNITVLGYFLNDHKGVKWDIFKKVNNIKFPLKLADKFPIYHNNIIKKTPLVIALNFNNKKVIDIYEPFPNDLERRNVFYKRMHDFFDFLEANNK